jgi:hypothetical protein
MREVSCHFKLVRESPRNDLRPPAPEFSTIATSEPAGFHANFERRNGRIGGAGASLIEVGYGDESSFISPCFTVLFGRALG